ncbi:MAG: hypothetical protein EOO38_03855 [Cytophagaceae bacterium]|nr:MAG: hypothetical protein EOO38_03855 [Cytophagaceae bacterium]
MKETGLFSVPGMEQSYVDTFGGVTCSECGEKRMVRDSDRLCFDCWEKLGEPRGPGSSSDATDDL